MFSVIVLIEAVEGKEEELIKALNNSAYHAREEESCLRWEWSQSIESNRKFFIYEIYTNEKAFLEHKNSPHFLEWVKATSDCIEKKSSGKYIIKNPDNR